jgi:hypothetical protein
MIRTAATLFGKGSDERDIVSRIHRRLQPVTIQNVVQTPISTLPLIIRLSGKRRTPAYRVITPTVTAIPSKSVRKNGRWKGIKARTNGDAAMRRQVPPAMFFGRNRKIIQ